MKTKQGNMLQSLRTVQGFLDEHAAELADVNATGARQLLDAQIIALADHVQNQSGCQLIAMGLTQRQYALRKALLRDHMAVIARIARANADAVPDLTPFKLPRGRPTAQRLSAAAIGMAQAAAPYASVFVENGARADFVAGLENAAAALVEAITDRTQSQGMRRGATSGLQSTLSAGRKTVHILDALVQSALHENLSLLASWNVVKRVRRTPSRPMALADGSGEGVTGATSQSIEAPAPGVSSAGSPALQLMRA